MWLLVVSIILSMFTALCLAVALACFIKGQMILGLMWLSLVGVLGYVIFRL